LELKFQVPLSKRMRIELSIIIPTLNEEKYLPRLLESIKKQTYKNYEIIVSDAGSCDRTVPIAKKYRCKVVKGGLPAKGRNNGAKIAKGKHLLFLDSDVLLFDNNFLQRMIQEVQKKKADIGTCKAKPIDADFMGIVIHTLLNIYWVVNQWSKPYVWGPCIFASKKIFNKIGGFDTRFRVGEDIDFGRRAAKAGKFRVLNVYFGISVRRFRKEGYIKGGLTYIKVGIGNLFNKIERDDNRFKFYGEKK